jgi:hypothetical protein
MMVTLRRRLEPRTTGLTTFDDIREIAHALPGVVDGTSYGTPHSKWEASSLRVYIRAWTAWYFAAIYWTARF